MNPSVDGTGMRAAGMKALIELFRRSLQADWAQPPESGSARAPESADSHDIQRATAALLFEVSRADFHIHDDELLTMRHRLAVTFDLDPEELDQLMQLARGESDELLSLHPFVRVINDRMSPADKYRIMVDLWHVAYADGTLDPRQEATLRHIADLLYIPHASYLKAKMAVEPTGGAHRS
jgi:uncharacterized tellurite resistance protein B-like protein